MFRRTINGWWVIIIIILFYNIIHVFLETKVDFKISREKETDYRFKVAKERQKLSTHQNSPSNNHTRSLTPRKSAGDGTSVEAIVSPTKLFNPFPKPANGILSAEKARIGVKLGLYKAQDAMVYMNKAEKTHFLNSCGESKHDGGACKQSSSTIW